MKRQLGTDWLETTVKAMVENGGDLGEDYPALLEHIKKARHMELANIEGAHLWGQDMRAGDGFPTVVMMNAAEQFMEKIYEDRVRGPFGTECSPE